MVLQFILGLEEEDIILIPTEIKLMLKEALRPRHQELQSPILQKSIAHRNLLVQVNLQVTNQGHQKESPMRIFKYLSPVRIDVLQNLSIRFTQPSDLNDPFEQLLNISSLMTDKSYDNFFNLITDTSSFPDLINEHLPDVINENLEFLPDSDKRILKDILSDSKMLKHIFDAILHPLIRPELTTYRDGLDMTLKNSFDKIIGILSLTQRNNNITMWSHYSDNHKGFVIEFSPESDLFKNNKSKIRQFRGVNKVKYTSQRPISSIVDTEKFDILNITNMISKIFFTKSPDWKYEEEIRMLTTFNPPNGNLNEVNPGIYVYQFKADSILNIFLGYNASESLKEAIICILKQHNISNVGLYKAILSKTEYKLEFQVLNF